MSRRQSKRQAKYRRIIKLALEQWRDDLYDKWGKDEVKKLVLKK